MTYPVAALFAWLSVLAALDSVEEVFLSYGLAGLLLFVLFWFLKALVEHGVKPFVAGTLSAQTRMAESLTSIQESHIRIVGLVESLNTRLTAHMASDERTDRAILREIEECHGKVNRPGNGGGAPRTGTGG